MAPEHWRGGPAAPAGTGHEQGRGGAGKVSQPIGDQVFRLQVKCTTEMVQRQRRMNSCSTRNGKSFVGILNVKFDFSRTICKG